jgi:hypothetical protein
MTPLRIRISGHGMLKQRTAQEPWYTCPSRHWPSLRTRFWPSAPNPSDRYTLTDGIAVAGSACCRQAPSSEIRNDDVRLPDRWPCRCLPAPHQVKSDPAADPDLGDDHRGDETKQTDPRPIFDHTSCDTSDGHIAVGRGAANGPVSQGSVTGHLTGNPGNTLTGASVVRGRYRR